MNFSFMTLLNSSIAASWLVLAVIGLRLILKRAPKAIHCALWALVAIRLLCPFSIESEFSLVPSAQTVSDYYQTQEAAFSSEQTVLDIVENPVYPQDVDVTLELPAHRMEWSIFEWTAIWPVGMAAMALYMLISWLRLRRKVSASIPIARDIRLCDYIASPFILGIFRPRIYLPSSMDQETLDHVLAHEMAHLKRRDHWWKPLGFLLLTVHWFNPMMWLAYILLCRDIELACDEKVIRGMAPEEKKAYSASLLRCSVSRPIIAACPLAFGEVGVKERVKSVLHYKKPAFWMILIAVIACIVVAVCFLTDPLTPDAYDVMYQNGYTVLAQCDQYFDLSIPAGSIPADVFSEEGHRFDEKEVVVYQTDTSTIWLMNVQYANEGADRMYFEFNISHDIPRSGTILLPSRVEVGTHNSTNCFDLTSRTVYDNGASYPDAVAIRANGPEHRFTVYIDTEVAQAAQEEIRFSVSMNQLTYAKQGSEPEIPKVVHPYDSSRKTWAFYSDDIPEFEVGLNERDQVAFYTPYEAFTVLTEKYADAIAYIQDSHNLAPLTPLNYLDYKKLGWQTTSADEQLQEDCIAVSEFLDIYENSFSSNEAVSETVPPTQPDRLAVGTYRAQEAVYWNPLSSSLPSAVTLRVLEDGAHCANNTFEVDWGWQEECPLTQEQLEAYYEYYDIMHDDDPILGIGNGCVYQILGENFFLCKRYDGLYLVNWRDSSKGPEIVWYIYKMVPESEYEVEVIHWPMNEYSDTSVSAPEEYTLYETIRTEILKRNTFYSEDPHFTTVSLEIVQQLVACGAATTDGNPSGYTEIYAVARVMTFCESDDGLTVMDNYIFPLQVSFDEYPNGAYVMTDYWQCPYGVNVEEELGKRFSDFNVTAMLDGMNEKSIELELNCYLDAVSHFGIDLDGMLERLRDTYPAYFSLSADKGLVVYWWDPISGRRCVITEGTNQEKTDGKISAVSSLTLLEAYLILSTYDTDNITYIQTEATRNS